MARNLLTEDMIRSDMLMTALACLVYQAGGEACVDFQLGNYVRKRFELGIESDGKMPERMRFTLHERSTISRTSKRKN